MSAWGLFCAPQRTYIEPIFGGFRADMQINPPNPFSPKTIIFFISVLIFGYTPGLKGFFPFSRLYDVVMILQIILAAKNSH